MTNPFSIDMPWPQPGDQPFKDGENWLTNARLHFSSHAWDLYAIGYKDAADALVEVAVSERGQLDTLIYPISFLYRHYLELRLKEIIIVGSELVDIPAEWKKGHRLDLLWQEARKILKRVWPKGPKKDLDNVETALRQFWEHDPESFSFRYPVTKDGDNTLPGLSLVNVQNLKAVMNRVAALLDGSSSGIADYVSEKRSWYCGP